MNYKIFYFSTVFKHKRKRYLCLSEDVRAGLLPLLQDALCLIRKDVYLETGGHGGVDEAADYCGNLLLDDGQIAVRMIEVLYSDDKPSIK